MNNKAIPIEQAPKKPGLVFIPGGIGWRSAEWYDKAYDRNDKPIYNVWISPVDNITIYNNATHWHPYPENPQS